MEEEWGISDCLRGWGAWIKYVGLYKINLCNIIFIVVSVSAITGDISLN